MPTSTSDSTAPPNGRIESYEFLILRTVHHHAPGTERHQSPAQRGCSRQRVKERQLAELGEAGGWGRDLIMRVELLRAAARTFIALNVSQPKPATRVCSRGTGRKVTPRTTFTSRRTSCVHLARVHRPTMPRKERCMATLSVFKFDQSTRAEEALNLLRRLQQQQLIQLQDAAVVEWPTDRESPELDKPSGSGSPRRPQRRVLGVPIRPALLHAAPRVRAGSDGWSAWRCAR